VGVEGRRGAAPAPVVVGAGRGPDGAEGGVAEDRLELPRRRRECRRAGPADPGAGISVVASAAAVALATRKRR
jgi:hypothetical protein